MPGWLGEEPALTLFGLLVETITTIGAVAAVVFKLGRAVEKFEIIGDRQASEISDLKSEVKVIGDVVKELALHSQRQDMLEARMNRHEQLLDDMRRGEGFILPLNPRP